MGHYLADLMCDQCGKVHCECCPTGDNSVNTNWIVDDDFTLIRVVDFDTKYQTVPGRFGPLDGMPVMRRLNKPEFPNRWDAEIHARQLCEQAVAEAKLQLARLENLLFNDQPWLRTNGQ